MKRRNNKKWIRKGLLKITYDNRHQTNHNNNDMKIEEEQYPASYYNYFLTGVVIH